MRFTRGSSASLISESQTEEIAEDNRETEESETESISAGSEGPKPKKFRSDVWDFFTKVPGGKKVLCGRGGSRVSKEGGHLSEKQLKTKKTC